jgi:uncharacterized membrane protein (UPF0127 family)
VSRGKVVGVKISHPASSSSASSLQLRPLALRLLAFRILAAAALFIACHTVVQAAEETLEIVTKNGVHVFTVEVARTNEERQKGLMFRKELPEGRGMLFDFKLDMLFINGDGTIRRIAENTEPLSERTISSGGPVRGVLEVIGGTAKKLGIAPGDKVAHPLFTGP